MSFIRKTTTAAQIMLASLLCLITISACTRLAANATATAFTSGTATNTITANSTGAAPRITVNSIQVMPREGIYVTGSSTLPAGECLKTELLADQNAAAWWPRDLCLEMDDTGEWELLVALGRSGTPQNLETGRQYEIRAWWPTNPEETTTHFYFDLDGPPSPP